ncbi:hypothetical protein C8R44DRAFT_738164 [Mycena epipterygia]|nr:hypothetical protein C8R44DRAFT_738158 [Mycena epipterygia]KAJ7118215.1 hypothetical protein C8R44DRAFT_738164 [Mycena epipterygia]
MPQEIARSIRAQALGVDVPEFLFSSIGKATIASFKVAFVFGGAVSHSHQLCYVLIYEHGQPPKLPHLQIRCTPHQALIHPASKHGKPRIVPMIFACRDNGVRPLGFERIDIDIAGLYGQENIFAARQTIWRSSESELESYERYTLYHNLNPDLPVNRTMACLSRVISGWYNSAGWRNLLDREQEFNEQVMKPASGSWLNPWSILLWLISDNSRSIGVYGSSIIED